MDDIAAPHDTYFRESFSRRDIAEDFLRHHLPAPLLAEIDLATLEVSKDTYVSTELRTAYSDLVYRVRCRTANWSSICSSSTKAAPITGPCCNCCATWSPKAISTVNSTPKPAICRPFIPW